MIVQKHKIDHYSTAPALGVNTVYYDSKAFNEEKEDGEAEKKKRGEKKEAETYL